jgi:hypothetical protein
VGATLTSAHRSRDDGNPAAVASQIPDIISLFGTADAAEEIASFAERRIATFIGPLICRETNHPSRACLRSIGLLSSCRTNGLPVGARQRIPRERSDMLPTDFSSAPRDAVRDDNEGPYRRRNLPLTDDRHRDHGSENRPHAPGTGGCCVRRHRCLAYLPARHPIRMGRHIAANPRSGSAKAARRTATGVMVHDDDVIARALAFSNNHCSGGSSPQRSELRRRLRSPLARPFTNTED